MNKEKQIEEMRKDLLGAYAINKLYTEDVAEYLYNAGYRKASVVVWEIFDKVDEIAYRYLNDADYSGGDMIYDLNELKKKYTEEGK